jgi:hypothetical protein
MITQPPPVGIRALGRVIEPSKVGSSLLKAISAHFRAERGD